MQPRSLYSKIAGTGSYLPDKILTNADLEKMVDTTSAWILARTGIERRHIVAPEQSTLDMVEHAARRALQAANAAAEEIDLIALGTTTPAQLFSEYSVLVAKAIGT